MNLLPNVYLLSGFPYGLHQNVYAIDLPEENALTLIDTGLDELDYQMMQSTLKRWNLSTRKITKILLTHSHFDHSGNAYRFEKEGTKIYIGEKDADAVQNGDEHTLTFAYGRVFPVCRNLIPIKDGETIKLSEKYAIKAYHTPGHTPGSMCYELIGGDETVLFTGDFVQPSENPDIVRLGIKVDSAYDYNDFLESAKKMSEKRYDCIFAGHYHPVLSRNNILGTAYRELLVNRHLYL